MSRRVVMVARGVIVTSNNPRQEEVLWLAQSAGDFRRGTRSTTRIIRLSCWPRSIREVCSCETKWLYIICMLTTRLKCALWGTRFPPTLCQGCGRNRSLNYWINDLTVNPELFCCFLFPLESATYIWHITRYISLFYLYVHSCIIHYWCGCKWLPTLHGSHVITWKLILEIWKYS